VLLGLGGKENWQRHILETAKVINETEPDFVRIRRLWLYQSSSFFSGPECPLFEEIRAGEFIQQTPEGSVFELRLLIEKLENHLTTLIVCDHQNNYVHVSGVIKDDKKDMLATIEDFLNLPEEDRERHYQAISSKI